MVIDLKKCIGCYSCVISVQASTLFATGHILHKDSSGDETGDYPQVTKHVYSRSVQPLQECALCCAGPSGATTKREQTGS